MFMESPILHGYYGELDAQGNIIVHLSLQRVYHTTRRRKIWFLYVPRTAGNTFIKDNIFRKIKEKISPWSRYQGSFPSRKFLLCECNLLLFFPEHKQSTQHRGMGWSVSFGDTQATPFLPCVLKVPESMKVGPKKQPRALAININMGGRQHLMHI